MKNYLLFDLDGTLTDPKEGICTCVQYALASFGIEEPDLDKLEPFIGPPLKDSFMEFYGMGEEQAEQAVEKYRERFREKGIFENRLYQGIPRMLRTLKARGLTLAVASSKPKVFVEQILEHFKIAQYFKVIMGSELDGTRGTKEEVVRAALRELFGNKPIEWDKVYMIGDRCFDVEGAHAVRVESVGVTYGYGSMEELKAAKSDYIVRSVEELEHFLLRGADEAVKKTTAQRIWQIARPFLMFYLVKNALQGLVSFLLVLLGGYLPGESFWFVRDGEGVLSGFTGNGYAIISALGFIGGAAAVFRPARRAIEERKLDSRLLHLKKEPGRCYVLLGMAAVGASLGLNILFDFFGMTDGSEAYQQVAAQQYGAWLPLGLLCYGVIAPIAEELVFRGLLYHELRRFLKMPSAMVTSAALFAMYHGNAVQGLYAFAIGMLMVYAYEYFGDFKFPLGIHIGANVLVYLLSATEIASGIMNLPACFVCLVWAVGGVYFLNKEKAIF